MVITTISKIEDPVSNTGRGANLKTRSTMVIMTKEEVQSHIHAWPANTKAPIDRNVQIKLMQTASKRHEEKINRIMKKLEDERKGL